MAGEQDKSSSTEDNTDRIECLGSKVIGETSEGFQVVRQSFRIPLDRLVQVGEPEINEDGLASTKFRVELQPGDDPIDFGLGDNS
jgi:hypothetical protein